MLTEIRWPKVDIDEGDITLRQPDLGYRLRLTCDGRTLKERFGANWIKPGLMVELNAEILNSEQAQSSVGEFFNFRSIPTYFGIPARPGAVHGDLNLENILFPDKITGWLIDFEKSSLNEMVALDCAKMEVEIWNNVLLPTCQIWQVDRIENIFEAIDELPDPRPFLSDKLETEGSSRGLLSMIQRPLAAIAAIRHYVFTDLQLTLLEYHMALAGYSFSTLKWFKEPSDTKVQDCLDRFAFFHLQKAMERIKPPLVLQPSK